MRWTHQKDDGGEHYRSSDISDLQRGKYQVLTSVTMRPTKAYLKPFTRGKQGAEYFVVQDYYDAVLINLLFLTREDLETLKPKARAIVNAVENNIIPYNLYNFYSASQPSSPEEKEQQADEIAFSWTYDPQKRFFKIDLSGNLAGAELIAAVIAEFSDSVSLKEYEAHKFKTSKFDDLILVNLCNKQDFKKNKAEIDKAKKDLMIYLQHGAIPDPSHHQQFIKKKTSSSTAAVISGDGRSSLKPTSIRYTGTASPTSVLSAQPASQGVSTDSTSVTPTVMRARSGGGDIPDLPRVVTSPPKTRSNPNTAAANSSSTNPHTSSSLHNENEEATSDGKPKKPPRVQRMMTAFMGGLSSVFGSSNGSSSSGSSGSSSSNSKSPRWTLFSGSKASLSPSASVSDKGSSELKSSEEKEQLVAELKATAWQRMSLNSIQYKEKEETKEISIQSIFDNIQADIIPENEILAKLVIYMAVCEYTQETSDKLALGNYGNHKDRVNQKFVNLVQSQFDKIIKYGILNIDSIAGLKPLLEDYKTVLNECCRSARIPSMSGPPGDAVSGASEEVNVSRRLH